MNKKRKIIELILAIPIAAAILTVVASALAGLLMLGWNVVGVTILSVAVPISFLTALKGIGILYALLFIRTIIKTVAQAQMQKMQMQMAMSAMKKFEKEMQKAQGGGNEGNEPPDLMRHFR